MTNILETKDLKGGYGQNIKIIHGIDLHVKDKEIVCIIGPNGSGKSTLIKVIYGLATHHGYTIVKMEMILNQLILRATLQIK